MSDESRPADDGFEIDGTFYRWSLSDHGKDLMLIDRFTAMPIPEFFAMAEDGIDRGRAPVLLAMIATSIRAGHPDWSVDRIARMVQDMRLSEVHFSDDTEVEEDGRPPEEAAPAAEAETSPPGSDPSGSSADGSSSSSTPTGSLSSETLYAVPA